MGNNRISGAKVGVGVAGDVSAGRFANQVTGRCLRGGEVKPYLVIESGHAVGLEGLPVDLQDAGMLVLGESRRAGPDRSGLPRHERRWSRSSAGVDVTSEDARSLAGSTKR